MKITAIVGTYRKGGIIDTAVDIILAAAQQEGAEVRKIHLMDQHIEFCTNCRLCTQSPGEARGACPTRDDMAALLDTLHESDAIVLASPVNFGTVTAVMKRFIERLVCFAYWPWGSHIPKARTKKKEKLAVLVASSAAPAPMARLLMQISKPLETTAGLLGAKILGSLYIGLAAGNEKPVLSPSLRARAIKFGRRLYRAQRKQ